MKKLLFGVLLLLVGCSDNKEKRYCGTVVEKGKEEPTSGYKSKRDATYFIIMRTDSCNQTIRVNVTVPTFYNAKIDSPICFLLDGWDLYGGSNVPSPSDTLKCN